MYGYVLKILDCVMIGGSVWAALGATPRLLGLGQSSGPELWVLWVHHIIYDANCEGLLRNW